MHEIPKSCARDSNAGGGQSRRPDVRGREADVPDDPIRGILVALRSMTYRSHLWGG